jgi:hypothetical protein
MAARGLEGGADGGVASSRAPMARKAPSWVARRTEPAPSRAMRTADRNMRAATTATPNREKVIFFNAYGWSIGLWVTFVVDYSMTNATMF